jgi:hypothetical protein
VNHVFRQAGYDTEVHDLLEDFRDGATLSRFVDVLLKAKRPTLSKEFKPRSDFERRELIEQV